MTDIDEKELDEVYQSDVQRLGNAPIENVVACLRDLRRYAPTAHHWGIHVAIHLLDALSRVKEENERLRAGIREINDFALCHHDGQEDHLWLHALHVDIPWMCERLCSSSPALREEPNG